MTRLQQATIALAMAAQKFINMTKRGELVCAVVEATPEYDRLRIARIDAMFAVQAEGVDLLEGESHAPVDA